MLTTVGENAGGRQTCINTDTLGPEYSGIRIRDIPCPNNDNNIYLYFRFKL